MCLKTGNPPKKKAHVGGPFGFPLKPLSFGVPSERGTEPYFVARGPYGLAIIFLSRVESHEAVAVPGFQLSL